MAGETHDDSLDVATGADATTVEKTDQSAEVVIEERMYAGMLAEIYRFDISAIANPNPDGGTVVSSSGADRAELVSALQQLGFTPILTAEDDKPGQLRDALLDEAVRRQEAE